MKNWKQEALVQITPSEPISPIWDESVPICSDDKCQHFDGKRCRVIGDRPSRICEPAVMAMAELLED